ncbi:uncharacterized protein LOC129570560 [Sitodiplosis mosellana]|uniref:uncharacterized protein LOC129570560 n=1 Tax=Sitodiplosis mosellana TaxID=263140 RepID=UPI0024438A53|nr:uncharacterized protein LOC129570560 [Sitodiplosis mosellana]
MDTEQDDTENANRSIQSVDEFCWQCDKRRIKVNCSTCFRSFHDSCLSMKDCNNDGNPFVCLVCELLQKSEHDNLMDRQLIARLLELVMGKVAKNKFHHLERLQGDDIINPIGLKDIEQKIDSMLYTSLDAFIVDIECIYHNYAIRNKELATVEKLVKLCESEIDQISSCANCYENKHKQPNGGRTLACSKPHLVLWVKLDRKIKLLCNSHNRSNSFWPAKLLTVIDGDKMVKVSFFGRSELSDIPIENCFIYSNEVPRSQSQAHKSKDLKAAQKEVTEYGRSIQKEFGRFQIKSKSVPFNPKHYNAHMAAMFPDILRSGSPSEHDYCGSNDDASSTDGSDSSSNRDDSTETETDDREESEYVTGDSTSDSSETKTVDESSDHSNEAIPKKRPRLSEEKKIDTTSNSTMPITIIDSSSDSESNSGQKDGPIQSTKSLELGKVGGLANFNRVPNCMNVQRFSQHCTTTSNRTATSTCTSVSNTTQFNLIFNPNQATSATANTLLMNNIGNCVANSENTLQYRLMNQLRTALENIQKSHADCQAKHDDLLGQLRAVTAEHDQAKLDAKNEVAKIRSEHVKEISQLMQARTQETARIESLEQSEAHLNRGIRACLEKITALEAEKDRTTAETEKLKVEHRNTVNQLRIQIQNGIQDKQIIKQLQQQHSQIENNLRTEITILREAKEELENSFNANSDIQFKMESNHKHEVEKLRKCHEYELRWEKKNASNQMDKFRMEHNHQVADLENKLKAAIEGKSDVEAQLRVKTDKLNNAKSVLSSLYKDL